MATEAASAPGAPGAVSANKAELIAIADAVAREKLIDRMIVIEAMEDAIQRAARARYGAENDIRAKLDPTSGDLRLWRVVEVVEDPAPVDHEEITRSRAASARRSCRPSRARWSISRSLMAPPSSLSSRRAIST